MVSHLLFCLNFIAIININKIQMNNPIKKIYIYIGILSDFLQETL